MKRIETNLIGIIGLLAWGAISVSNLVPLLAAGPRVFPFIPSLLAEAIGQLHLPAVAPFYLYLLAYALAALLFACAYWSYAGHDPGRRHRGAALLPALQIAIALATDTQLLVIVAIALAYVLPPRRALPWLAAQMAAYCALQGARLTGTLGLQPLDLVAALLDVGMSLTWMALAFGIGYLAARERRSRIRLAGLHADLLSTQHLMMDALRLSERASIARNLHDAIGHHLAALNLHLDLGLRQAGAAAPESLGIARGLAGELLREVRSVVSLDQQARCLDLRAALQVLVDAIPSPRVTLHYDEALAIGQPEHAHAILRCVQEGITNAIRHAGASRVEVHVCAQAGGVSVRIADDGAASTAIREGNGLRGMRERLHALRGTLDIHQHPGRGVDLRASLPAGEA